MLKSDIIKELADIGYYDQKNRRITHSEVKQIVDSLFEFMGQSITSGRRFEIRGFGCFSLRFRAAGTVRNPRHGVSIPSDNRYNVYFRPGRFLAQRVNKIYDAE